MAPSCHRATEQAPVALSRARIFMAVPSCDSCY
jgi:hypothetical protein